MHPKLVLTIMLVTLALLVGLCCSPVVWRSSSLDHAIAAHRKERTEESFQKFLAERNKRTQRVYGFFTLPLLNIIVILVYGGIQLGKRSA
jgi:hypothetical protein